MAISGSKLQQILQKNRFVTGGDANKVTKPTPDRTPAGVRDPQSRSRIIKQNPSDVLHVAMTPRKTVLVLSPFISEDRARASILKRYAKECTKDSIRQNEAPMCSNLFYYDTLNIHVSIERDWGLQSMLSWVPKADLVSVYVDMGISEAMQVVINTATLRNVKMEYRMIGHGF